MTGPFVDLAPNWSRDGHYLAYYVIDPNTTRDLWYLPLMGERKPVPFLQTPSSEALPRISPDGRSVAYMSNESGQWEVYVKPFPRGEGKWQVSVKGGHHPRWSGRGNELFYLEGNTLMAVPVETQPGFKKGLPRPLFTGEQVGALLDIRATGNPMVWVYDVTADGQRFVVVRPVGESQASIMVAQNWAGEFKK